MPRRRFVREIRPINSGTQVILGDPATIRDATGKTGTLSRSTDAGGDSTD
jgi:hypothetical protein